MLESKWQFNLSLFSTCSKYDGHLTNVSPPRKYSDVLKPPIVKTPLSVLIKQEKESTSTTCAYFILIKNFRSGRGFVQKSQLERNFV
jgi:hypothetical protein